MFFLVVIHSFGDYNKEGNYNKEGRKTPLSSGWGMKSEERERKEKIKGKKEGRNVNHYFKAPTS